jgi:hypothetical protein
MISMMMRRIRTSPLASQVDPFKNSLLTEYLLLRNERLWFYRGMFVHYIDIMQLLERN